MDQKEGFLPEAVTEVAQSIQMDPLAAHSKQDRTPNNDSTVWTIISFKHLNFKDFFKTLRIS